MSCSYTLRFAAALAVPAACRPAHSAATHNTRVVTQSSHDHGGTNLILKVGHELLRVLGDAAANDEQVGGEEHLNVLEVAVQALAVLLPGQLVHLAGTGRSLRLGVVAVDLQVTQLGVRDQLTVVDEGGANAGAQGDDSDQAVTVTALTVGCLSQARCVSVVEAVDGAVRPAPRS